MGGILVAGLKVNAIGDADREACGDSAGVSACEEVPAAEIKKTGIEN